MRRSHDRFWQVSSFFLFQVLAHPIKDERPVCFKCHIEFMYNVNLFCLGLEEFEDYGHGSHQSPNRMVTIQDFKVKQGNRAQGYENKSSGFGDVKPYEYYLARETVLYCWKSFEKTRSKMLPDDAWKLEVDALKQIRQDLHPHVPWLVMSKMTRSKRGKVAGEILTYPWCETSFEVFWKGCSNNHSMVLKTFVCMCSTVSFVNKKGLKHRDISDQNMRFHDGKFVLLDFGVAKKFGTKDGQHTFYSNDPFICPEGKPSEKGDAFQLALTMISALRFVLGNYKLELLNFKPKDSPWTTRKVEALLTFVRDVTSKSILVPVVGVLEKMLAIDVSERITAFDATRELNELLEEEKRGCSCMSHLGAAPLSPAPRSDDADENVLEERAKRSIEDVTDAFQDLNPEMRSVMKALLLKKLKSME